MRVIVQAYTEHEGGFAEEKIKNSIGKKREFPLHGEY